MIAPEQPLAALIGLDWADAHHDISLQETGSDTIVGTVATVAAGEQSGHLDVVLERLADYSNRFPQHLVMAAKSYHSWRDCGVFGTRSSDQQYVRLDDVPIQRDLPRSWHFAGYYCYCLGTDQRRRSATRN